MQNKTKESTVSKWVDAAFSCMYVLVAMAIIATFFDGDIPAESTAMAAFIICMAMYFAQKIVKGVLCTVARSFD